MIDQANSAAAGVVDDGDLPLEHFLSYKLLALTSRLNRQASQILEEVAGVGLPEWRCIAIIGRFGRTNLHGIATQVAMDRALVSRTVDSLTRKGLVRRERDTVDRRVVFVELTKAGMELFRETFPAMQARQRRLLDALGPDGRESLFKHLEDLNKSLEDWEAEKSDDEAG